MLGRNGQYLEPPLCSTQGVRESMSSAQRQYCWLPSLLEKLSLKIDLSGLAHFFQYMQHTHPDLKGYHLKAVSNYCISSKSRFCFILFCFFFSFFSNMPMSRCSLVIYQIQTKKAVLTQYTQQYWRYRVITIKDTWLSNIFSNIKYTLHGKLHEVHSHSLSSNLCLNNMVVVLSTSWHHQW